MRIAILSFLAIGLLSCSENAAPDPVADEETLRKTTLGDVVGFETADGAHSWRAIPFAAPPVGELRWRAPRPAAAWDGVRDGTHFAERCLQLSNRLNAGEGIKPGKILGAEDCLYLDVYAPPDAAGKDLPVMVWIHGGANVWGRSSSYEGSRLAVNEDVIVVAVQYRVGPFGFFAHDYLREGAATAEDRAANFALLDLVASLEWVRHNIAAFGGDPETVTIFGESAGGANVAALMASPLAEGLFHRAIIQSGSFASTPLEIAENSHLNASTSVVERVGAASADDLRALSPQALLSAYGDGNFAFLDMPTMIADGISIPATPMRDAFYSLDGINAVPVITGTNRDEMKFFYFGDPRFVKRKFFLFPAPRDRVFWDRLNHYMARVWRILAVDEPAAAMVEAGNENVYAYRFDWDESGKLLFSDFSELVGAGHSLDIPFVFNRFEFFGERYDKIFFEEKTGDTRQSLSRDMGAYWAAFARTGNPGDAAGVEWAPWPQDGATLMRFDSPADGGIGVITDIDTAARLTRDLLADPQLNADERCLIVAEIDIWDREFAAPLIDAAKCPAQT